MKVIFLPNNTASLMSARIPKLRDLGVDAIGFNFAPKVFQDIDSVTCLPRDVIGKIFFCIKFFYHLVTADVVHWVYGGSSKQSLIILKVVGLLKRRKFVEFCGTDIRSLEKMCADADILKIQDFSESLIKELGTTQSSQFTQEKFSSAGFMAMPNSPELADYIDPNCFSKYILISRCIDLEKFPFVGIEPNKKIPLVVHMPSNPEVKGTKYFLEVAEKLKNEGVMDYKMISGVPHNEAMEILKSSDIVIDQLVIGEYGVLSIEAMAMGKPVLCFIRPQLEKHYNEEFENFPIVNASVRNLEDVLRNLLSDSSRRRTLSSRGRDFAIKYHDAVKNTQILLNIYRG